MTSSFIPLQAADSCAASLARAADSHVWQQAMRMAEGVCAQWARQAREGAANASCTLCIVDFAAGAPFLALLQAWRTCDSRPATLHVVALASRPWTHDALRTILHGNRAPGNSDDIARLLAQWPALLPGQHRLVFDDAAVTLTLLFGQGRQVLDRAGFGAHGFLGMDLALLGALTRHARPHAWWMFPRDASVPEQAMRQVGFVLERTPMRADLQSSLCVARRREGLAARVVWPEIEHPRARTAIVVGAGMAGASIARTLAARGWAVTLIGLPNAHQGHRAAALTPVIARDDNPRARLTRAGALRARAHWLGFGEYVVRRTGTLQLDRARARAADTEQTLHGLQFPPNWVRAVDARQASVLAGLPVTRGGLFFADGMLVRPDRLIARLAHTPGITPIHAEVYRIAPYAEGWEAVDATGRQLAQASQIIVASAHGSVAILHASGMLDDLPQLAAMQRVGGQVTCVPATDLNGGPACVIGGEGYVLPAVEGQVVVGSTYVHGADDVRRSHEGQMVNLDKMGALLDLPAGALQAIASHTPDALLPGWAGWRGVVPGRLPVIGKLAAHPGAWVACAYASRGLTWSALAADMIAGALAGEPDVLDRDLAAAVAPR